MYRQEVDEKTNKQHITLNIQHISSLQEQKSHLPSPFLLVICRIICFIRQQKSHLFFLLCIYMFHHMFLQITRCSECSITHLTLARLLTSMNPLMCFQMGGLQESLPTQFTPVWLLSSMCHLVPLEMTQLSKGMLTHSTFIWSLPLMHIHMRS